MTVVGLRVNVDALVLIGDRWQAPQASLSSTCGRQEGKPLSSLDDTRGGLTLGSLNTSFWIERSKGVKVHDINETWRLGRTMVRNVIKILPGCSAMVSADERAGDTLFLPILFAGLRDWVYADLSDDAEVSRSQLFFAHALSVVALEVVLALRHRKRGDAFSGVLVISCLNNPLDALELYFSTICRPRASIYTM